MFGFGSGKERYHAKITIAAIGMTGRHGREMVYDCEDDDLVVKYGDSKEEAEAIFKVKAMNMCRAALPGADSYRIISYSCH